MQEDTKHALRMIAFSVGCISLLIGAGLLVIAYANRNPYSETDARPFMKSVSMNGTETQIEFTSSTNQNYALRLNINLPAEAKEKWVEYNCLIGTVLEYHSCEKLGQLNFTWTIRDITDGNWHNWEPASKPNLEVTDGIAGGAIAWFTPASHHRYLVTFKAGQNVPAISQSTAELYAYFGDEGTQSVVAFGGFLTLMWVMFATPFIIVGLLLVLIFFPRQMRA